MIISEILKTVVQKNASDLFIIVGTPIAYKAEGRMVSIDDNPLKPDDTLTIMQDIYQIARRPMEHLNECGDDDFSFSVAGVSRFRTSVYRQRGTLAAVIRIVRFDLPKPADIGLPDAVLKLADKTKGMVLITGPAGSGKSTTLACMIDRINHTRSAHVITLEDPLEYLHSHNKSIVSQREVHLDTDSYVSALRASLRQAPDVILLGEMRDHETMGVAMTAAETGHLLLSTLHTVGAANSVDRIIDAFPPTQQQQIRVQLAQVLQAVVSQQLIPAVDGGVVPAFEIMIVNTAIRNMIRESKTHQMETVMYSSANEGMLTMDSSLLQLYQSGKITKKDALLYSLNPDTLMRRLG